MSAHDEAFDAQWKAHEAVQALWRIVRKGVSISHEERDHLLQSIQQTHRSHKNLQTAVDYAKSLGHPEVTVRWCDIGAVLHELEQFRELVPKKDAVIASHPKEQP